MQSVPGARLPLQHSATQTMGTHVRVFVHDWHNSLKSTKTSARLVISVTDLTKPGQHCDYNSSCVHLQVAMFHFIELNGQLNTL